MSKDGKVTALVAAALLLSSLSLGGCMTSTAGSSLMDARAEAPPKTSVYLPVEDLPPKREKPAMTADERSKLQKELIAARDRQASDGKARGGAARRPQPIKP
jgi:predicted small secreted protein